MPDVSNTVNAASEDAKDDTKSLLIELSESSGISGFEMSVHEVVKKAFAPYADEVSVDRMGSVIAVKRGEQEGEPRRRVMLAGHIDEIGLIVTKIEKGFMRFTEVGGFDERVLVGQEVTVYGHGKTPLPGVVASAPPHVTPMEERKKPIKMKDMFIDVGLKEEEVTRLVRPGDPIAMRSRCVELNGGRLSGKAFDDRAAIATMVACLKELGRLRFKWDVYAVATVQEEVTFLGAITSAYRLSPDVAVAIDVTHAKGPGTSKVEIELGKGPAIAFGANFHPEVYDALKNAAKSIDMSVQQEPTPGWSGTDAWAIQVSREGVPCGLVSIPLRYMHTPVETLAVKDVEKTGLLLALFIAGLEESFMEKLKPDDSDEDEKEKEGKDK